MTWTYEEYSKFIESIKDRQDYYFAIQLMYHCGIRVDEMFALTKGDIDFGKRIVSITKAYVTTNGKGEVTKPKADEYIRDIKIPGHLSKDLKRYLEGIKDMSDVDRIFLFSKNSLKIMVNHCAGEAGVKRIPIQGICSNDSILRRESTYARENQE